MGLTTSDINRHIDSDLDSSSHLVYFVDFTGDDGEARRIEFSDHADAYAFVRDELLSEGA